MALTNQINGVNGVHHESKGHYDAIVVGAGFGGLRMIYELRKIGLSYKVFEAGSGIGGTWYWNRYPGARTDSESWIYLLNVSKELNNSWKWRERFPRQPEVEEYLNYIAHKLDMHKDIQFKTTIRSAHYDEAKNVWKITTQQGETFTCQYFIPATGVLSVGRELPFRGQEKFKGESYKTFAWPKHDVDFTGKRIAVIGTGATAVQVIPVVAHTAKSLTVFQRTPNHILPARNHPLTEEQQKDIQARCDEIWQQGRTQIFGMAIDDSQITTEGKTEAQINRVLEHGWEIGGFRYIFQTFADLLVNKQANDIASEFVRNKIRAIVQDEETADALCPDHALMAKRPPLGHHYFETFNKPNVQLVKIRDNPIEEITENGLRLHDGSSFDFDMIIYAIGFDASTGPLTAIDVRGRDNRCLGEEFQKQLETTLGICIEGYPNMMMISGPQSPFANLPIVLDNTGAWVGKFLSYMREKGYKSMEPTKEGQQAYCKLLNDVYEATILPPEAKKAGSWYIGANIPGKPVAPLFWFGGVVSYFQICQKEVDESFPSFRMS